MLFAGFTLTGCHNKRAPEGKKGGVKGVVTSLDVSKRGDTIRSMKVLVDDDTLVFNMRTAILDNEMVTSHDSVHVNYLNDGHGDTLRALDVRVIPQPGKIVSLDSMKHNKLITR